MSKHTASSCRWGLPTLFLSAPFWFEAEDYPWTCLCWGTPRVLRSTEGCAFCSRWELRQPGSAPPEPADRERPRMVPMLDWFAAVRAPHEVD